MSFKLVRKSLLTITLLTFLLLCGMVPNLKSQTGETVSERVYDSLYRTILFHRTGWDLSWPVMIEGMEDDLTLHFDYLGESRNDLSYSIQQCTYDWKINDVAESRYLQGFNDVPIYDVHPSLNTLTDYYHFTTRVPGEDLSLLQSGNYLLRVHPYGMPDEVAFTRRFCLLEKKTEIHAWVKRINNTEQELQIEIDLQNLPVMNPLAEIKVVVIKNNNWANEVKYKTPPVLRGNMLLLDMPYQLVSNGGDEFRNFDIKSIKYMSERIDYIDYQVPYYHIHLKTDEANPYSPYFSSDDLNGRYYIENTEGHDRHVEADYLYVHFYLKAQNPLPADVYLYGALTDWELGEKSLMAYNYDKGKYVKTLRLKQGFYDYNYVTSESGNKEIRYNQTEGNYSETENEYAIFVYFRENMSDYDRLVGYKLINSAENSR